MNTDWNADPVILLFAIAVIVMLLASFVTTFERVETSTAMARFPPAPLA